MKSFKSISNLQGLDLPISPETFELLEVLESTNPCGQIYYKKENSLVSTYRISISPFTYRGGSKLSIPLRVVGLPVSLASQGYWTSGEELFELLDLFNGISLVLNSRELLKGSVRTLPTYILRNTFSDLEEYLASLRSSYRRRLRLALDKRSSIKIESIDQQKFSREHYELYLDVIRRTQFPLETLSLDFFRRYPARLTEFRDKSNGRLLAFTQTKVNDNRLVFMFCGFREEDVKIYDLYWNMLISVLEEGFEEGTEMIELGQTSAETKLKLGCYVEERYMLLYHKNPMIRKLLQLISPLIAYNKTDPSYHVFKEADRI